MQRTRDLVFLRRDDERIDAFHQGQKIWVEQSDGSQRAAIFAGEAELTSWFGGGSAIYVVSADAARARKSPQPARRPRAA